MIAGLKKINAVVADKVNDAVFLGEPPGSGAADHIFKRFRIVDA